MDPEELLRAAFAAIADADGPIGTSGTLQFLTGRTELILIETELYGSVPFPVITMDMVAMPLVGGTKETYEALWQFDAYAENTTGGDQDASKTAGALLTRLVAILTEPALVAQGLDAVPSRPRPVRRGSPTGDGKLRRRILDAQFRISV